MSGNNVIKYDPDKRYRLTTTDVAKLFKVSAVVVKSYIKKGLPHTKRGAVTMFDLREITKWYVDYSNDRVRDVRKAKTAEQSFLREMIDGKHIIEGLLGIDMELEDIYAEIKDLEDRFENCNGSLLLTTKGAIDPTRIDLANMLDANKTRAASMKLRVLESRRQGMENLLRKKLPDLRSIEMQLEDPDKGDVLTKAYQMFKDAASKA